MNLLLGMPVEPPMATPEALLYRSSSTGSKLAFESV
jgi:hypothetical protein